MKLSLRELFLLVVIAAMGCGWWVERQSAAIEMDKNEKLSRMLPWKDVELISFFEEYLREEGYTVEWEVKTEGDSHSGSLFITDPSGTSSTGTGFSRGPGPSALD